MKVVFLEVETQQTWGMAALGPAFIAPFLRREGHQVRMLRVRLEEPLSEVVRRVQDAAPSILGLSLATRQWLRAREVVGALRRAIDVPVIAGGLHPSFAPEAVLAAPGFDYVCLGEGEEAMGDLLRALEAGRPPRAGIANIWAKGGARPALRPPLSPLDAIPFAARDLLDEQHGVLRMTTQRGCPFPCTHCAARLYDELYRGAYGRRRSPENVVAELTALQRRGQVSYVIFLDDTFTLHHPWVRAYSRLHGERVGVSFSIHARAETVSPRLLEVLAAAGCKHVVYGVESGSERIRRDVLRRPVNDQRLVEVFRWTRQLGIIVTANYMLGIPGETRADVEATLALHDRLAPDDFGYFVYYPYPGTRLFELCQERGYLPDHPLDLPADHRRSILKLPGFGEGDIAELYERFTALRVRDHLRRAGTRLGEPERERLVAELRGAAASS